MNQPAFAVRVALLAVLFWSGPSLAQLEKLVMPGRVVAAHAEIEAIRAYVIKRANEDKALEAASEKVARR